MKTIVVMKNGNTYTHPNCFPDITPWEDPQVLVLPVVGDEQPVLKCNLHEIVSISFEA